MWWSSDRDASRLTEFYNDYLDSYNEDAPPPPPPPVPGKNQAVAAWARSNANPPPSSFRRTASKSVPVSSYAPSLASGATVRRKLTRRTTTRASRYDDDDEEGYGSGEYEDSPFELIKIRVKVRLPFSPRVLLSD
jgi:hypothetical protein